MWEHPATRHNVALLRQRGAVVTEPAAGRLTGKDTGKGRLADPEEIVDLARLLLAEPGALPRDLEGLRVVVSAGGTREPLDPVRYLGNRSSGKQGYALARVAAQRGAEVTLIAAHTVALAEPAGVTVQHVSTAEQLRQAAHEAAKRADVVVMAAAVADFRPANFTEHKIKKSSTTPGLSSSARAATCWWSTRSATARPSKSRTTEVGCFRRMARSALSHLAPSRNWRPRCGTPFWICACDK
jgi:phosphopantothenoylcysteine decarboxylase/phosphopantothenate--cysteine ligase